MAFQNDPPMFPLPWAEEWGEDADFGLYLVLIFAGVRQVFRWIEPTGSGGFPMGSSNKEDGRWNDEDQHQVELDGFWLADTTVTQALYESVMEENPSQFEAVQRPVDSVSWKDAQTFIKKLNEHVTGLSVCLPSEAQWEYACRAGTSTPFWFGGKKALNQDMVNYSGKWDAVSTKGETRQVKSYPANPWGLYDMHGNVWEWCKDYWQENLGNQPVANPHGPKKGDDRVLRGGSWFNKGRLARSAYRGHDLPSYRNFSTGFRLALGPELKRVPDKSV